MSREVCPVKIVIDPPGLFSSEKVILIGTAIMEKNKEGSYDIKELNLIEDLGKETK